MTLAIPHIPCIFFNYSVLHILLLLLIAHLLISFFGRCGHVSGYLSCSQDFERGVRDKLGAGNIYLEEEKEERREEGTF